MNGFLKRKLPAFLLALILIAGLMPSALAIDPLECDHISTDDHRNGTISIDDEKHTVHCATCGADVSGDHNHNIFETVLAPTCFQSGLTKYTCSICRYSWTETTPATDQHTFNGGYSSNEGYHWQTCSQPGCTATDTPQPHQPASTGVSTAPTCTAAGYTTYRCRDCQQEYTVSFGAPLGHTAPNSSGRCDRCGAVVHSTHTFPSAWVTDSGYHWHACSECGAQGSRGAHVDSNNDGRCDVCNYGMSSGVMYTVTFSTGSGTSTETVAMGAYPKTTPSVPSMPTVTGAHIFKGWISGSTTAYAYRGQSFVTPAGTPVNSNLTYSAIYQLRATGQNATFSAGTTSGRLIGTDVRSQVAAKFYSLTGVNSFSTIRFTSVGGSGKLYATSSKATLSTGNYSYNDLASYLYFVPSTAGSLTLNYTAADAYDNQISGTLTISGITVSNSDILYRVAPGGTVNFKTSDFEKAYSTLSGSDGTSVRYVAFLPTSSYDSFAGAMYTGSREMTRDRLNQWSFYISNDRYGGDYELSTVNFKADSDAKEGAQLTMSFRVYYNSATYYDGTLTILIDKDGQEGDVVYRVAPGGSVTFNRADFNNAYQALTGSSRTIRYVEFDPGTDYTSFSGKIRAVGHSDFDRNSLSREQFNYSGTSYGDYALDDLTFQATSAARDGDTLEIPFWACYSRDDYAEGTLRIIVDKYGSQDTITLNVAPGGTTRLDKTAFNEVYRALSEYANRTISAVSFSAPDSYKSFAGALYVRNTAMTLTDLTHSKTWFYYSSSKEGDYALDDLTFQTTKSAREGDTISIPFRAYYNNSSSDYVDGTLRVNVTSAANTITYEAAPGGSVDFQIEDFNKAYQTQSGSSRTIRYVAFEAGSDYASFAGSVCASGTPLTRSSLTYTQTQFYYSSTTYGAYALSSLSFRPDAAAKDQSTLSIPFRAYYDSSDYEEGTLKLVVNANAGGDVAYVVTPGKTVNLERTKFDDFYRKTYSGESFNYIVFETPGTADFPDSCGTLYAGYNTSYSTSFSRSSLRDVRFYYNASDAGRGDYALNDVTFAAASSFTSGKVVLRFTAYGSGTHSVDGTLVITPAAASTSSSLVGSVRYAVTSGTNVQINANDLARFYQDTYPNGSLQYVTLAGAPAAGALYYNYYNASAYGSSVRAQITASTLSRNYYLSPASTSEYALTELTYVPSGSNYCATIPFTAYGTGGQSVSGSILISVTTKAVSEVYGPTPKNTAVSFSSPAASIYAAVSAATGTAPTGFQLLKLPAASVGVIYVGSDTSTPANTTTVYGYNTGAQQLGQLRFVPATNYTGPVDIPYVALNASGTPIASGVFSMGVLNSNKKFSDITASTWCYKYVTELADASVIDGYSDGSFKPDSTITYGAALKLIMLAAGYPEQAPTVAGSTFSGYLSKAQADGLITRSNVNLSGTITRLQVAQLAAGALKLDINNLSSVKPFTDTADVYVQALNAAGIVEGYFDNGTSTFRPSNTLTRGQVSAIVWRMQNYRR